MMKGLTIHDDESLENKVNFQIQEIRDDVDDRRRGK